MLLSAHVERVNVSRMRFFFFFISHLKKARLIFFFLISKENKKTIKKKIKWIELKQNKITIFFLYSERFVYQKTVSILHRFLIIIVASISREKKGCLTAAILHWLGPKGQFSHRVDMSVCMLYVVCRSLAIQFILNVFFCTPVPSLPIKLKLYSIRYKV